MKQPAPLRQFSFHPLTRNGIICAVFILTAVIAATGPGRGLNNYAQDLAFLIRGPAAPCKNIAVVAIDEASFGVIQQQWPWDRQFHDCFFRSESQSHFFNYMTGQFSDLEKKSIEPIALALKDGNVRALQRFVSDAPWDDDKIGLKYRTLVNDDLGNPDGALIFDESGFPKKGDNSVGVTRQYCGTVGKVDNCQVGVFARYVSDRGYALVDKRLYVPEKWFDENYKKRRKKCNLPEETIFKTKPELAVEMLGSLREKNMLPFKYVLADSIYGVNPEFMNAVDAPGDMTYLVQVLKSTQVWLKDPGAPKGFNLYGV